MKKRPSYLSILEDEYSRRKKLNERYSLRSFARQMKVDSSLLSKILSGKRNLSYRLASHLAKNLKLNEAIRKKFTHSSLLQSRSLNSNPLRSLPRKSEVSRTLSFDPNQIDLLKKNLDQSLDDLCWNLRLDEVNTRYQIKLTILRTRPVPRQK